jgi:hypothetical protein
MNQSLDIVGVVSSILAAPTNPANDLPVIPESSPANSGQRVASKTEAHWRAVHRAAMTYALNPPSSLPPQ